jgi:hypothetical protein
MGSRFARRFGRSLNEGARAPGEKRPTFRVGRDTEGRICIEVPLENRLIHLRLDPEAAADMGLALLTQAFEDQSVVLAYQKGKAREMFDRILFVDVPEGGGVQ